jgi:hypothetical protein
MSIVCIHQPDFVPYLGFFHRLLIADHFFLLDDVQFIRRGWHQRDRLKSRNGSIWLTLSLCKGDFHQRIDQVMLSADCKWIENNLNVIRDCYAKAPYFNEVFPRVEAIYRAAHKRMMDLNRDFLELAMEYFQIDITMSYASDYFVNSSGSQRLVDLVQQVGCSTYLTGTGSKAYLEEEKFIAAGLKVVWQKFNHPVYPQLHGEFEEMLSCLDILFNCGQDSAAILRSTLDFNKNEE